MYILCGVAALFAAAVLYAWAYGQCHRPGASRFYKRQIFASTISLIVTGLAPIGAGLLMAGLTMPWTVFSSAGLIELAVAVGLLWVLLPRLLRPAPRIAAPAVGMPMAA